MRQMVETGRFRILLRVCGINTIDLRSLEDRFRTHFGSAQRGRRVRREERVSVPPAKITTRPSDR